MKNTVLIPVLALLFSITSFSQEVNLKFVRDAVVFKDSTSFVYVKPSSCKLATAFVTVTLQTEGARAEARVPVQDTVKVIIKVKNVNDLPTEVIKVYMVDSKDSRRVVSLRLYGRSENKQIPFDYDIYGDDCYILYFNDLAPGEYMIWYEEEQFNRGLIGDHSVTYFGVD